MGHIQRRGDGRWRARYRETAGSKERSRTFSRRVDAERFLTGIEHSKLMGNYVDPSASRITFRLFAEDRRQQQIHRPGTATSVEQQLRLHVYPVLATGRWAPSVPVTSRPSCAKACHGPGALDGARHPSSSRRRVPGRCSRPAHRIDAVCRHPNSSAIRRSPRGPHAGSGLRPRRRTAPAVPGSRRGSALDWPATR